MLIISYNIISSFHIKYKDHEFTWTIQSFIQFSFVCRYSYIIPQLCHFQNIHSFYMRMLTFYNIIIIINIVIGTTSSLALASHRISRRLISQHSLIMLLRIQKKYENKLKNCLGNTNIKDMPSFSVFLASASGFFTARAFFVVVKRELCYDEGESKAKKKEKIIIRSFRTIRDNGGIVATHISQSLHPTIILI